MEQFFRVGVFANTHGIRGEIKVFPTTDDIRRFDDLKEVILETKKKERIPLEVEGVKYFKNQPILKFKGIDDINQIEKYKGSDLLVSRENAVPLEEGEFYIADIIGMPVFDEAGAPIGEVKEVMETGANFVFIVNRPDGRELLLPSIPECILEKDFEHFRMTVHMMDGLEDL